MEQNNLINLGDFSKVLEHKGILDIKSENWKKLSIWHGEKSLQHYNFKKYQELRTLFTDQKNIAGIYAYFMENSCLYIGKSKNLQERIYQHFLESCKVWGHIRYQEFFSSKCEIVDLFVLKLGDRDRNGEFLRTIVEKILEAHYNPELASIKL